jgi:magnesium-transporting ATPase (P-type)
MVYALWGNRLPFEIPGIVPAAYNILPEQVPILAVTVFHAGVVMAQIGNVFACRTETNRGRRLGWFRNRLIWLGVLTEVVLIVAMIYVPFLAEEFDHLPMPKIIWAWLVLYAPILYSLDWLRKGVVRWMKRKGTSGRNSNSGKKKFMRFQEVV